jgi:CheY-like chemotaxis protein
MSNPPRDIPVPCCVLIVDDNRDSAESLAMLLEMSGHEVTAVHDGPDAIRASASIHPDVVLLDLGLPGLNGYEVCRHIRQQPWGKNIMLIAQTGSGMEEDKQLTHAAGFDLHMVKPLDLDAVVQLLASLPEHKRASR